MRLNMRLKEFLELIRTDEIISIYDPIENQFFQKEIYKEDVVEKYLHYKVIGINTNYDNAVLEIDIFETIRDISDR